MIIYIKMDLALNNLQRLICHKTKPTKQTNKKLNKLMIRNLWIFIDMQMIIYIVCKSVNLEMWTRPNDAL